MVFVLAAGALNPLCLKLSTLALAILFFYSYTKRFASLSHLVLGFCLGIAPAAAWIAGHIILFDLPRIYAVLIGIATLMAIASTIALVR